jgi:hypothetical protein
MLMFWNPTTGWTNSDTWDSVVPAIEEVN